MSAEPMGSATKIIPPGTVVGHSSEEEGPPDVGFQIVLPGGNDACIWIGEISRSRFEESGGAEFGAEGPFGWWIVHYGEDGSVSILGWLGADLTVDVRGLADLIGDLVRRAVKAEARADKVVGAGTGAALAVAGKLREARDSLAAAEKEKARLASDVVAAGAALQEVVRLLNEAKFGTLPTSVYEADQVARAALDTRATHRHLKRGGLYRLLIEGIELQTDGSIREGTKLTIYIGGDGRTWARPTAEFEDGRFEPIKGEGNAPR